MSINVSKSLLLPTRRDKQVSSINISVTGAGGSGGSGSGSSFSGITWTSSGISLTQDTYVNGNLRVLGDVMAFSAEGSPINWWDSLPTASSTVKGGVKIGANLSIDDNGVLSSIAGGVSSWNDLQDKPSTFAPTTHNNTAHSETYITGINSGMVTSALGYTPYNSSNPSGYITSAALSPYAPLANPTFTGNVAGITKAMVGLGNVANESKAAMFTSPVFTGNASFAGNLAIGSATGHQFSIKALSATQDIFAIYAADGLSYPFYIGITNDDTKLVLRNNANSDRVFLNANGTNYIVDDLAIGTSVSAGKLTVSTTDQNGVIVTNNSSGNATLVVRNNGGASSYGIYSDAAGRHYLAGNLGIGTASPASDRNLTISRNVNVGIKLVSTGTNGRSYSILSTDSANGVVGALAFYDDTAGAYRMYISSAGNVVMNNNLSVVGEVTAFASSDKRLKTNIQDFNALDIIKKIQPKTFQWNDKAKELNDKKDDRINYGLIAQDLEKILPELVHPIYGGQYKAVDYEQLIPILIKSIQELQNEIHYLKNNMI